MSLAKEILDLLRGEGYRINEAIEDGLTEFTALVEEENEGMDDDLEESGEDLADED